MTDLPLPALPRSQPTQPPDRRWLRLWAYVTRPLRHAARRRGTKPTPEEIAMVQKAAAEAVAQKQLEKQLNELAAHYRRLIINALTRVGVSHVTHVEGKRKVGQVEFYKPALVTTEAIYFQVKTTHLPWHINIDDLLEESTINTLMFATGRVIQVYCDRTAPEKGFWIIVELKAGVRGIPRHVDYNDMLKAFPKTAGRFTIAMGRGVAGQPVFADITEMPHLLVAGATGQGKSVWLEQMLLTLIMRNTPKQLHLCIVDLKNGVELGQFKRVPHLIRPVIKDVDEVIEVLRFAKAEIASRLKMFEDHELVDIDGWNSHSRRKLPRLIVVIDELAELMLTDLKGEAEPLLARIAALGRGAGVHAIIATQRPESRVITGLIKANFSTRLAFSCADQRSSMVILDTGLAAGIGPNGRMIYMYGAKKIEIQGPFVSPKIIRETVGKIIDGKPGEALETRKRHNLAPEDFFRHAIDRYPGKFPIRPIYEDLKIKGVTKEELLEMALRFEGTEFEVDGDTYTMTGSKTEGVRESRKLIKLRAALPDDDEGVEGEPEAMPGDALALFQSIEMPTETLLPPMPDAEEPDEETEGSDLDPVPVEQE